MAAIWDMAKRMFTKEQPVAYSRITRTPIYSSGVPSGAGGAYYNKTDEMRINPQNMGHPLDPDSPYPNIIPHESAHSIFNKGNLSPSIGGLLPESSRSEVYNRPNLYPHPSDSTVANESLAYAIGNPEATEAIKSIAGQIKDPKLAAQLLRLHENKVRGLGGLQ